MRNPICPNCDKEMGLISTRSGMLNAWIYKCECGCLANFIKSENRKIKNVNMTIKYKDEMEG